MKKLILFLCSNYPNNFFFIFLIFKFFKLGIKNLEIGIPNIDSIADGNLVFYSYCYIIKKWKLFEFKNQIYNLRIFNNIINIFLIGYYNNFINYKNNFFNFLIKKNVNNLIIIDYNVQLNFLKKIKMNFIKLYSSNINKKKYYYFLKNKNIKYLTYIKGITGSKKINNVKNIFNYFKKFNYKNTILGFGISNIEKILNFKNIKNIVIGSYIIHLINKFYPFYKKIFKIVKILYFIIK